MHGGESRNVGDSRAILGTRDENYCLTAVQEAEGQEGQESQVSTRAPSRRNCRDNEQRIWSCSTVHTTYKTT